MVVLSREFVSQPVAALELLGVSDPQLGCTRGILVANGRLGEVWHLKWLHETAHLSSS